MPKRRDFIKQSVLLASAAAVSSSLPGCKFSANGEPQSPVEVASGKPLPWINWAGNQHCFPQHKLAPRSEAELVDALASSPGKIRPVGASHSFSALVPTDETLLSTDLLQGLVSHDAEALQAEVLSGTRLYNLGPMLGSIGQALPNMPDMDYPSLGGAIATSVHGTGADFASMSSYIAGLNLVTPGGELIECSASRNPDVFNAARTSLGCLGVISSITLQNQASFRLTETTRTEKLEHVLAELTARFAEHRHFEFFPIPFTDLCITVATDLAKPGDVNKGEEDPSGVETLRDVFDYTAWVPFVGHSIYEKILSSELSKSSEDLVRTGDSFRVFAHPRMTRFREMEYSVPIEVAADCLREILATIRKQGLPLPFPFEYRHIKEDDIWLSMYQGRPSASISIHQFGDRDYKAAFAQIEPIFWKYEGRPHWGKIHTLDAERLAALYPQHWQDFAELRQHLDPSGKMLNAHLKQVLTG